MIHAPINFSVYVLALTVIAVVIVAHVSHLAFLIPVVWSTGALVTLGWTVAVIPITHIAVAVNSIFFGAPVFNVIRISRGDSSEDSVFVNLVVSFYSSDCPVVGLLSDEGLSDLIPWE